ncbi:MAG: TolC family protein [Nannocystaceae bacterium]
MTLVLAPSCANSRGVEGVATQIEQRTGHASNFERRPDQQAEVPPGVEVADGLSGEEAAAIALWNNPRLRVDLARLQAAEAEQKAARRPSNPTLRFLLPAGPQQFSLLLTWPLEAFLTMPRRTKIARLNAHAVAEAVVQTSLDLTRDTRLVHVDWVLSHDRLEVRRQLAGNLEEVAKIGQARAAAGDVPQRDADAANGDALVAADEVARAEADTAIARTRLQALMGWKLPDGVSPTEGEPKLTPTTPPADLEALALASRPDLRSAQLAIEATGARIGLEKWAVLNLTGVGFAQGNAGGPTGVTGGPEVVLPIFDQNQAGISRARAQLEASTWRYHDLRTQIVAEVAEVVLRWRQAQRSLDAYGETIVAVRQRELEASTAQFERGDQNYVPVLVAAARLEAAKLREAELRADLRRSEILLERAVGRRLPAQGRGEVSR